MRKPEHLNSWEAVEQNHPAGLEQPRGLFDFMRPGSKTRDSADRLAGDIAAGWTGQPRYQDTEGPYSPAASDEYDRRSYDQNGYDRDGYDRDGYSRSYSRPAYDDDLDQGWENFDDYDSPPPSTESGEKKRVYGDSLYGSGGFPEDAPNEIGPDGVYEADYRVIVPPSKPLEGDRDDYID